MNTTELIEPEVMNALPSDARAEIEKVIATERPASLKVLSDRISVKSDNALFEAMQTHSRTTVKGNHNMNTELQTKDYSASKLKHTGDDARQLFAAAEANKSHDADGTVRVKAPSEMYGNGSYVAKHAKFGIEIQHPFKPEEKLHTPSKSLLAKKAVVMKEIARQCGLNIGPRTQQEISLLDEMYANDAWIDEKGNRVDGAYVKASLLDSSTSGGVYAVPEWWDQDLIITPLLTGELLPFVTVKNVPYGSEIHAAKMSVPTMTWRGHASDGNAATPFDATGLISEITASVMSANIFLEVGRELLADTNLISLGAEINNVFGMRAAAEFDRVIAIGNGTTEPQGLRNASLTSAGGPSAGSATIPTITDLLHLYFSVPKQVRSNARFVMNDTDYAQARMYATGVTGDQRLLHGMDVNSYQLLNVPVSVQNNITLNSLYCGDLKAFRMWFRGIAEYRLIDSGRTMGLTNTCMFSIRVRVAGKVVNGDVISVLNG